MDTKTKIIEIANKLLIEKGFNAFSYKNISAKISIKTSSIHYHFPTKSDLGIAIIQKHHQELKQTILKTSKKTPLEKISLLFLYYKRLVADQKVCIVGALTSDINTLDEPLRVELLNYSNAILKWVTSILDEGKNKTIFKSFNKTELKAKLIITNLMALVQISRIEKNNESFDIMTNMILDELLIN